MTEHDTFRLQLANGEQATVSRYGGHVMSWTAADGSERLYLSPWPVQPGRPIRGGVPVCFPQFATRGPLVKHGFARTQDWAPIATTASELHLRLVDSASTRTFWPHAFQLDLSVLLEPGQLTLQLEVTNTGHGSWSFMAALHTYLRVDDVAQARLAGLEHTDYEDALDGGARKRAGEEQPDLRVAIDRVYRAVTRPLQLDAGGRRLRIAQGGFEDVVVWNPGLNGASQLGDMPEQDAPHMLCVEAGRIVNPVTLQPGQQWSGTQRLTVG